MDRSEKQGVQKKKLRKSSSNLSSRRGTGISASLGTTIPADGSGSASASTGAPAGSPGIGGGTGPHPGYIQKVDLSTLYRTHYRCRKLVICFPIHIQLVIPMQESRTDKRLNWSHEEDIRLVSAWLQNSLDPVDGNGKKSDQYWADVTNMYNSTSTSNRRRNRNQLKIRWDRIKKPVSEFHSCWIMTNRVYQSGMSDDQRTDKALQMYASEHDDKPFLLQHIWRVVKNERKWAAYVKRIDKEKSPVSNPAHADNVEDSPKKRPIGTKQAKAVRDGKWKPEVISAIGEKLDKFIDVSNKAKKMAEVQQSLANKKLEVAQLNHKAAQEQTRGKMVDLYRDLFCASTSDMSEEAKAERYKALECMKLALFTIEN